MFEADSTRTNSPLQAVASILAVCRTMFYRLFASTSPALPSMVRTRLTGLRHETNHPRPDCRHAA